MAAIRNLTSVEELSRFLERSHHVPVWLFKHSLVCSISSEAWRQFREFAERCGGSTVLEDQAPDFGVIEIQNAREVSLAFTEMSGIRHESPQAVLLLDTNPIWNASHWRITVDSLQQAADQAVGVTVGTAQIK